LLSFSASANILNIEIGGIFYDLNNETKEAIVVRGQEGGNSFLGDYTGNVVIPENVVYEGSVYSVTKIEGTTYWGFGSVSFGAFYGCDKMTSVTIPSSIKIIGNGAFEGCTSLKEVYISSLSAWCGIIFNIDYMYLNCCYTNPLYYAHNLYLNGDRVTNLVIPDNIVTIKKGAFMGSSFTSVTFHKGVEKIEPDAFNYCDNLTDVYSYSPKISLISLDIETGTRHNPFNNAEKKTLHIRERYKDNYGPHEYNDGMSMDWSQFGELVFIEGVDYTISYIIDSEIYKSFFMEVGETIVQEPAPIKEGYTFSGWSEHPNTMPNHDLTITGTFIPNTYKLTYFVDGEVYKICEIKCGETIIPEDYPIKKGMLFSGWSEIPEIMLAKDIEVTGTFSWSIIMKDNVLYQVSDTISNYCSAIGNYNASGDVTIAVSVDFDYCYSVTTIADKAFCGNKDITTINIPQTITSIGERAFANIDKLTDVTCWMENVPITDRTTFENSYINYVTLHVPYVALDKYKVDGPWRDFKEIVAIESTIPDITKEKCAAPVISYKDGKLVFESETDGAESVTTITSDDFGSHNGNEIDLAMSYTVSTYAKAEGYANSDIITAVICWVDAESGENPINNVYNLKARPLIIQSYGSVITIKGTKEGEQIELYNMSGQIVARTSATTNVTTLQTNLNKGEIVVVKIGDKSVKIIL
jgi:hypothetical protein